MTTFCDQVNEINMMRSIYQSKSLKSQSITTGRPSTKVKRLIAIGNDPNSLSENRCSEIYCPISDKWKTFDQFKCERVGFSSVVLGDELYVLGGSRPKSNLKLRSVSFH